MVAPPCTTVFVSCIHVYVSIYEAEYVAGLLQCVRLL